MAQKNIVVAESGLKVALFPRAKDPGKRITLDAKQSKAVREAVREYCAQDARELPYHDRLSQNLRVGLKGNNAMLPALRAIWNGGATQEQPKAATGSTKSRSKSDFSKMTKAELIEYVLASK